MPAETNVILTTDLAPAISIDLASNFSKNINSLREVLGITTMQAVPVGTTAKQYKLTAGTLNPQTEEGDIIPLTEVTRALANEITITLTPYRKSTTAQAIQANGREMAINDTDAVLISKIQNAIKTAFYSALDTTGVDTTVTGEGLQAALANAWGAIERYYEDYDASPVHFVSVADVADYLGKAQISLQTAFGMTYIENFLGLGTLFVTPSLTKGTFFSTAKENLRALYVPATAGDVGQAFGLNSDETGLIGFTHQAQTDRATIDTLIMTGVTFFPEMVDGVFKGTITAPAEG